MVSIQPQFAIGLRSSYPTLGRGVPFKRSEGFCSRYAKTLRANHIVPMAQALNNSSQRMDKERVDEVNQAHMGSPKINSFSIA